jgi:aldehyde:ferredoxin oxidoreductase
MYGLYGRYLDVDLTSGTLSDYPIREEWTRKYLGGRGIGLRILHEELVSDAQPLEPENILICATGPLQGTGLAGAGRHAIVSKSPKTGSFNDAYAGGFWAHELATSGYDGIIVRGRSPSPVYLALMNGKATIESANGLWGQAVGETDAALKSRHGGCRVLSIGPAGENLVSFACVMNDVNRAAGRPGFGAVMGSKNLKAIAVKGGRDKAFFDGEMLGEIRSSLAGALSQNEALKDFGAWGTTASVLPLSEMGILPTKNFQEGVFDDADKIDGAGDAFKALLVGRDHCTGCPIRCKRVVEGSFDGQEIERRYGGPEYETAAALGSFCMNASAEAVSLANQLCNAYGLDTISAGVAIAFAMEASEKGLISERISWGNPQAIVQLVGDMAFRRGLGDPLANGIDRMAKEIGADFAMHIKGQELPMHDPRGKVGLGLSYATTPRGAQHMEALHDPAAEADGLGKYGVSEIGIYGPLDRFSWDRKPRFIKVHQDLASFSNSAVACAYVGFDAALSVGLNPYPLLREAIYAATGMEIGVPEMLAIGERNFNLLKIAAAINGYDRTHDGLPKRLQEPLPRGNSAGAPIPEEVLQQQIDAYYELRGWDDLGPTDQTLRRLDMAEFIGYQERT